jgi:hypothetical protein
MEENLSFQASPTVFSVSTGLSEVPSFVKAKEIVDRMLRNDECLGDLFE